MKKNSLVLFWLRTTISVSAQRVAATQGVSQSFHDTGKIGTGNLLFG
jgi:hypothetical protein